MKVRSFLIALTSAFIFLALLMLGLDKAMAHTSQVSLENKVFKLPKTAQFFPKETALTLHLNAESNKTPQYFEDSAHLNKTKESIQVSKKIIDGLFALIGLDFDADLAEWISPQISLALLEPDKPGQPNNWVLGISSLDQNGAQYFLQRFWQKKALAGANLKIASNDGVIIISDQKVPLESNSKHISTALINNQLLLLASKKKVLERSLTISQLPDQNQLGDEELKRTIKHLKDGVAFITISPQLLHSLFSLPLKVNQDSNLKGLNASLRSTMETISFDGIFQFVNPIEGIENKLDQSISLINEAGGPIEGLAFLNSTSELLSKSSKDPLKQLIRKPLLDNLYKTKGIAAKAIIGLDEGPLLWIKEPQGWVLGTSQESPLLSIIDKIFMQQKQVRSEVIVNNQVFQIWSKLIAKRIGNHDTLDTELGVILSQGSHNNWWGENLESLQQKQEKGLFLRQKQLEKLNQNPESHPFLQLALNSNQAKQQLENWHPWRLLQALTGNSLQEIVKGLALSIDTDWFEGQRAIHLRANIQIA